MDYMSQLKEAQSFVEAQFGKIPSLGIILGSGLGIFADSIEEKIVIDYKDIPHFPVSTVAGHSGKLIKGKVRGKEIIAMQGRVHYYEGYDMQTVVFPTRLLGIMGVKTLIITNAAGGVDVSFSEGDIMLIIDHINMMGDNPLIGKNYEQLGTRFPDMSNAYDKTLRQLAKAIARKEGIALKEGVYLAFSGPTYETAAEIRMARVLGANAVGMSTIPECIAANHMGIKVLGFSVITNMATGIKEQPATHEEVMETTKRIEKTFSNYIAAIIEAI